MMDAEVNKDINDLNERAFKTRTPEETKKLLDGKDKLSTH